MDASSERLSSAGQQLKQPAQPTQPVRLQHRKLQPWTLPLSGCPPRATAQFILHISLMSERVVARETAIGCSCLCLPGCIHGLGLESQIQEAIRSSDVSRKKFGRLRSVCIAAQQGLLALLGRLEVALSDGPGGGQGVARSPSHRFSRSGSMAQKAKVSGSDSGSSKGAGEDGQGNTIEDEAFFPELPRLVKDVAERLSRLVAIEARLVAAMAGTEAGSDAASEAPSGISSLASGFRRRTWAGPAWLEAIAQAGIPMPSTPPPARRRKGSQVKGATAGGQAASSHPDFSRILGYMGEEGEDIAAAELDVKPAVGKGAPREETPWEDVPDRDYIKHRTMKILAKRDAALRSKHANMTAGGASTASKGATSDSRTSSRPATAT